MGVTSITRAKDFLTEPTLCPQHIDEFDLKDETSLSKYDEVEQNIFICHMALPPCDQRHLWLRYQVEGYTEEIVHDFEQRLKTIFGRQVNRLHILDFEGLTPDIRQDLAERLRMVYTGDDGQEIFLGGARRSMTWRQFILALGLHTAEEMAEDGFEAYWLGSERVIPDKGDLSGYWIEISSDKDFFEIHSLLYIHQRSGSKAVSQHGPGAANVPYLLAQYLFRHAEGRKSSARLSGGYFIGRLAHHFGLVSDDGLRGLSVVTRELPLIDMGDLVKLNIYMEVGDYWAWAVPIPIHAPPSPPPAEGRTMPLRLGRLEEEIQGLRQDVRSLRGLMERSMTDQGRFSTWMINCMTQLMEASGRTYLAFDETFRGSYPEVKIVERERVEGEARLLDSTVGRVVPLLLVASARAESELEASVEKLFDEGGSTEQGDSAAGGGHDAEFELVTVVTPREIPSNNLAVSV
ncbi:hypothetical protein Tco_0968423 [Tanacetum coccineum]